MSETMPMPPLADAPVKKMPTVYFIDDSATMREVIKIAFRRENISVITCADAASALAQFDQNRPDIVITDVIMPDQDGYSVCSQIKQHPEYGKTPVVLMSGVVNKSVADKAVSVKADELIRKPFQPQELIGRVKSLLDPQAAKSSSAPDANANRGSSSNALTNLFAPAAPVAVPPRAPAPAPQATLSSNDPAWPRALAEAFIPRPQPPGVGVQSGQQGQIHQAQQRTANSSDALKFRAEIARLELLVKKLQTELQIERQYNQALEQQIQALTQIE